MMVWANILADLYIAFKMNENDKIILKVNIRLVYRPVFE